MDLLFSVNFKHKTKQWIFSPKGGGGGIPKGPQEEIFHIEPPPGTVHGLTVPQNTVIYPRDLKSGTQAGK